MSSDEILPHNNIVGAINILRGINRDQQHRFAHCRDTYSPTQYAREMQTIAIGSGRQTGKTTYIAGAARPQDLVIALNSSCAKYLKQNMRCDALVMTLDLAISGKFFSYLSRMQPSSALFDVYIDDASFVPPTKMKALYEGLSHYNVSQYILLG